jgi:hypothetical protein
MWRTAATGYILGARFSLQFAAKKFIQRAAFCLREMEIVT